MMPTTTTRSKSKPVQEMAPCQVASLEHVKVVGLPTKPELHRTGHVEFTVSDVHAEKAFVTAVTFAEQDLTSKR